MLLIHELGYEIDAILALNTKLKAPKGRMELIVYGTNGIFVDYAHTPDATLNVLESAQEFKKGRKNKMFKRFCRLMGINK